MTRPPLARTLGWNAAQLPGGSPRPPGRWRLARQLAHPLVALLPLLAAACSRRATPPAPPPTLHTVRLPAEHVEMPPGPSREVFLSGCSTCHSPRYIIDQPRMPRKTWQAVVHKMRTTYGAPVPAEAAPDIVNYIVSIRGDGT